MEQRATYLNTLKYALAIAGSEQTLALRLRVSTATLNVWLHGTDRIPTAVFLDAVDVIVAATPADIARTRYAVLRIDRPNANQ